MLLFIFDAEKSLLIIKLNFLTIDARAKCGRDTIFFHRSHFSIESSNCLDTNESTQRTVNQRFGIVLNLKMSGVDFVVIKFGNDFDDCYDKWQRI